MMVKNLVSRHIDAVIPRCVLLLRLEVIFATCLLYCLPHFMTFFFCCCEFLQ